MAHVKSSHEERKISRKKLTMENLKYFQKQRFLEGRNGAHNGGKEKIKVKKQRKFSKEDFIYDKVNDCFTCRGGKTLRYKYYVTLRNNGGKKYQAKSADCIKCPLIDRCTKNRSGKKHARTLYIYVEMHEANNGKIWLTGENHGAKYAY